MTQSIVPPRQHVLETAQQLPGCIRRRAIVGLDDLARARQSRSLGGASNGNALRTDGGTTGSAGRR